MAVEPASISQAQSLRGLPRREPFPADLDSTWRRRSRAAPLHSRTPGSYQPEAAGSAGTAPVGPGDNFQVMAIGVGEVNAPPAVVAVDLARAVAHRVGPVLKPSLADAAENGVKISLADQEGVVLRADRAFGVSEVERDPVVEFHHVEMAEASRRRPTQHLGQEPSGHRLVGRPDDGVVELSSHAVVLVDCAMTVS